MLKPQKVIAQDGDSFTIHTYSSLRNYLVKFKVGEEFDEDNKGLDNRKCKVKMKIIAYALIMQSELALCFVVTEGPAGQTNILSPLVYAERGHLGQ